MATTTTPQGDRPDGWYAVAARDVAQRLGVDPAVGLSSAKAAELLQEHGPNALPSEPPVPGWRRFAAQYRSSMRPSTRCCSSTR